MPEDAPLPLLFKSDFLTIDASGVHEEGSTIPFSNICWAEMKRLRTWEEFYKPLLKILFGFSCFCLLFLGPDVNTPAYIDVTPHRTPLIGQILFRLVAVVFGIYSLRNGWNAFFGSVYTLTIQGPFRGTLILGPYCKADSDGILSALNKAKELNL